MYCKKCSRKIDDNVDKCPYCGEEVKASDLKDEFVAEEKKIEKTQTGMLVGLVVNMFGLIGLKFLDKARKTTTKFTDPRPVDKNSYIRGVFFGSLLQILIILLLVKKFK